MNVQQMIDSMRAGNRLLNYKKAWVMRTPTGEAIETIDCHDIMQLESCGAVRFVWVDGIEGQVHGIIPRAFGAFFLN